jgi:hypothetical protein
MVMKITFSFALAVLTLLQVSKITSTEKKSIITVACPDSKFISASPTALKLKTASTISVKFYNSGNCDWATSSVKLYAHLEQPPSGVRLSSGETENMGIRDNHPGYLVTSTVAKDKYYTFSFKVTPYHTGIYQIKYYLTQSLGRGKFGQEKIVSFTIR